MSNEGTKKTLRDEMGDGYLSLLDSVRHSFEQAAWGQETSGSLVGDFYQWAGAAETASQAADAAELGNGVEVQPIEVEVKGEPEHSPDRDWNDFEAWIDGRQEARGEHETAIEQERNGPELGD